MRARKLAAEFSGIQSEKQDGTVTLTDGTVVEPGQDAASEPQGPPPEVISCESVNLDDNDGRAADKAMMQSVLSLRTPKSKVDREKVFDTPKFAPRLSLAETDVAKVTKSATVHLAFQPRIDGLILACADKNGHVSLWQVDASEDHPSDGVHMFLPHRSYVSGLEWVSNSRLVTCSYDGSVRALHAERAEFKLAHFSESQEYSALVSADTNTLWLGTTDGTIQQYDQRMPLPLPKAIDVADRKLNSLSFHPTKSHLLASTASNDHMVCIWDIRRFTDGKSKKAISELDVGATSQSAYWAPDGSGRLLVTSRQDSIRVFTDAISASPSVGCLIRHNTNTGRWVIPFRAVWTPDSKGLVVGDMRRSAVIYDGKSGKSLRSLRSPDLMTAIPSRNACHPYLTAVACATNSGRLHVYRA